MKNYLRILKLLALNMFRSGGQRKSKWMYVAYAILGLIALGIIWSLCSAVYTFAPAFAALGLTAEVITLIFGVACIALILFGLIPMVSYLYFAKDVDFFLTLPVKSSVVFLAKFTVVYVTELAIILLFMLPILITAGVALSLPFVFYVTIILAMILSL